MSSFRAELEPRLGIPLDYRINTGRGSPSTDPRRWTHHYDASWDTGVPTEETLWICSIASAFHSGFHQPLRMLCTECASSWRVMRFEVSLDLLYKIKEAAVVGEKRDIGEIYRQ
jgi:hypothetical protein